MKSDAQKIHRKTNEVATREKTTPFGVKGKNDIDLSIISMRKRLSAEALEFYYI
jgi:hypothetical protein